MRMRCAFVAALLGGVALPGVQAVASAPGAVPMAAIVASVPGGAPSPGVRAAAAGSRAQVAAAITVRASGRLRLRARTTASRIRVTYVKAGRSTASMTVRVRRGVARMTLPTSATSVRVRADASAGQRASAWQRLVIPPRSPGDVTPAADTIAALEQELYELVNQVRASGSTCPDGRVMAPAPPLVRDPVLDSTARAQSAWQAHTGILSHSGAGGSSVGVRLSAAGFPWARVAEVVAAGRLRAADTLGQWLRSTPHCHSLLDPDVTRTGIGYAYAQTSTYRHFWTQDFGRP